MFKTQWNANFDSQNEKFRQRNMSKEAQDELKTIKKANILVIISNINC
jgi:hypothetical protein